MEDSSLFSGPFQSEGSRMTGGTHLIPGLAQGTDKRFLIGFGGKIVKLMFEKHEAQGILKCATVLVRRDVFFEDEISDTGD